MELEHINPLEIRTYWDLIKPGIEKVKEKSSNGWIAEDVYSAIASGQSHLFIGYKDSDYIGFLVLHERLMWGTKELFIWLCYHENDPDPTESYLDQLTDMARRAGAKRIAFDSTRAWGRKHPNYTPTLTTFHYEV